MAVYTAATETNQYIARLEERALDTPDSRMTVRMVYLRVDSGPTKPFTLRCMFHILNAMRAECQANKEWLARIGNLRSMYAYMCR